MSVCTCRACEPLGLRLLVAAAELSSPWPPCPFYCHLIRQGALPSLALAMCREIWSREQGRRGWAWRALPWTHASVAALSCAAGPTDVETLQSPAPAPTSVKPPGPLKTWFEEHTCLLPCRTPSRVSCSQPRTQSRCLAEAPCERGSSFLGDTSGVHGLLSPAGVDCRPWWRALVLCRELAISQSEITESVIRRCLDCTDLRLLGQQHPSQV